MNPKVSVIIPTYNRANLLPRAIKSVLNQTFKDFELIIIDDGSTDNTKQIVEDFQKRESKIKYVWQENSGGPANSVNSGLKIARGEYVALLENDDEWLPEKLEKQLEVFQCSKKKNLGFVGCNVLIINERAKTVEKEDLPSYDNNVFLKKLLAGKFFFNLSMLIFKRENLNKIGFFDKDLKLAADQDICLRMAKRYNFDFVPIPLVKVYIHGENVSRTSSYHHQLIEWLHMTEKHQDLYKKYPKIYSYRMKHLGTLYALLGDCKLGRHFFISSITIYPLNLKSYLNFLISFLGSKTFEAFFNLRKKLKRK